MSVRAIVRDTATVVLRLLAATFAVAIRFSAVQAEQWSDSVSVGVIDQGYRFEAELYKPRTVAYEPIYMRLRITNVSNETRILPPLSYLSRFDEPLVRFDLLNAQGERFPLIIGHAESISPLDTNAMKEGPGESKTFEFDLLWRVTTGSEDCFLMGLPAGEYSANISVYLDPTRRAPRADNTLTLPSLKITVIEPTGDAAEALRLLCRAGSLRRKDPGAAQSCYDSVLIQYSHTSLDERANIELIRFRATARLDRQQLIRARERYFVKYLNTPESQGNVSELMPRITPERMKELVQQIKDKPEAAVILRNLKEHHPWIFEEAKK